MRLIVFPGVFRPHSDARLLIATMLERGLAAGKDTLDLFTGSGVIALAAAEGGASRVTAVDIGRRAALSARLNALANGITLRVRRGDMFAPVEGELFDLITANPPYLPSASPSLPSRGAARAWEGGRGGRAFLDRLCDEAPAHLREDGLLLLTQSSLADPQATIGLLRERGLDTELLAQQRGPLGPRAADRAAELEAAGLIGDAPGEEIVVIAAARRPQAAPR